MNKRRRWLKADSGTTGIVVILLLLVPALAAADGMAFHYDPGSSLEPLRVSEQRAFIAHKDGIQRMFIAINLGDPSSADNASRAAVWIFPVPGSPDRAHVDVTDFVPDLEGINVERAFWNFMHEAPWIPMATQPHFLPIAFAPMRRHGWQGAPEGIEGALGVTTHKAADRWGIHAELITADSVDRVADYLRGKNVQVVTERLNAFTPYLSDKYALVVAWISSHEELSRKFTQHTAKQVPKWPTLYVEFPTNKPFYPMRPTSGYGRKTIRVSVFVLGWVSPDTQSWTSSGKSGVPPEIRYFADKRGELYGRYRGSLSAREKEARAAIDNNASGDKRKTIERFLEAVPEGEVPFTRIRISAPAETFTQDLRFSPNSRVYMMHYVTSSPWVFSLLAILLVVALSYVSAGISGKAVFGAWRPWALIGLWNSFTVAALVVAAWLTRRGTNPEGKAVTPSPRWESLVFGALVSFSVLMLFTNAPHLDGRFPDGPILQVLNLVLTVTELLIASWIVSKKGLCWPDGGHSVPNPQRALIPRRMRESFFRIVLMFIPGIAISLPILLMLLGAPAKGILVAGLIGIGFLIVWSGLMTLGLFLGSWIVRKASSVWRERRSPGPEAERLVFRHRKPEVLILGALTCIILALIVTSVFVAKNFREPEFLLRVAFRALIAAQLLIATWVLWKGASTSIAMEGRFSPGWPVAFAGLFPLLALCGLLIYVAVHLSAIDPVFFPTHPINLSRLHHLPAPAITLVGVPAIALIGLIIIAGFLNRKRIKGLVQDMRYGGALSTIFVILGVFSYLAVVGQLVSEQVLQAHLGDGLAALALLSGAWIFKGEVQEGPTKALRFGVLFSIVFTILNFSAFAGLRALLAAAGV